MPIKPNGFAGLGSRADHFKSHRDDFPTAASDLDYERMAKAFLTAALSATLLECVRSSNGDVIRFNTVTQEFAVMRADGVIKTFYKADPRWHGFGRNLRYFQVECSK